MKTLILSLVLLFSVGQLAAQSCCTSAKASHCTSKDSKEATASSAPAQFASLADNAAFVKEHKVPGSYTHVSQAGEWISYPTADGKEAKAYLYKSREESKKYLLVVHEWWGLNDYIRREAERYFQELGDVNVLALDLYDGKIARTQEEARQYVQAVDNKRAVAIIEGALAYAGEDAEIGTLGWCFGGSWSLQAALLAGDKAEACVIYYGMPEQEVARLKTLDCPVLGIFAEQDGHITPQVVEEFRQHMEEADKELEVKMYDAVHAFANPSNPDYDKTAAEDAYRLSIGFLKEQLD
jgi:carboxymethylenebutenolidase